MSGHSVGPWRQVEARPTEIHAGPLVVAHVFGSSSGVPLPKASNARLIAAAPELLSSLRDLLVCMGLAGWEGDPLAEKARAAIAKATGEQA